MDERTVNGAARAILWFILFVYGMVLPFVVVRWDPWPAVLSVLAGLVPAVLVGLVAFLAGERDLDAKARRSIWTACKAMGAILVGFALSTMATTRPERPAQVDTLAVPFDLTAGDFSYDTYLISYRECAPGDVAIWGYRRYSSQPADGTEPITGSDVVGWSGTRRNLERADTADPTVFGADEGLAVGRPISKTVEGAACGRSGDPVVLGGVTHGTNGGPVIFSKVAGAWAVTPSEAEVSFVDLLQESPDGVITVIAESIEDDVESVWCREWDATDGAKRLLSSASEPLVRLADGERRLDSYVYGGHVYLLAGEVLEGEHYRNLRLLEFEGCDPEQISDVAIDGGRTFVGWPRVAVGAGGRSLIGTFRSLEFEVFDEGVPIGSIELDLGYDPDNGGLYRFEPGAVPGTFVALVWARGAEAREGQSAENQVVRMRWDPEGRRCVRGTDWCQ